MINASRIHIVRMIFLLFFTLTNLRWDYKGIINNCLLFYFSIMTKK